MPALSTVNDILLIGKRIYQQVKIAKGNKAQCNRLSQRVELVINACHQLKQSHDIDKYEAGLNSLQQTLTKALDLVTQFTQKNWIVKLFTAKSKQTLFANIAKDLWNDIQILQLGINATQILNDEADKVDLSKDLIDIEVRQEEILRLNHEQNFHLNEIQANQSEQQSLIERHMASLQVQMDILLGRPKEKTNSIPEHLTIPFYQLELDKVLAKSEYSTIYLGRWNHADVAIKLLDRKLSESDTKQFSRELQIMSQQHHPNITQLFGACIEQDRACLVMEFMPGKSLREVLDQNITLSTREKLTIVKDICAGLSYLHLSNVLHRDLRSSNILLTENYKRAKLSDLGYAKVPNEIAETAVNRKVQWHYLAPELLLRGGKNSIHAEIYTLGLIIWEIFTGKTPYLSSGYQPSDIIMGKREICPASIPDQIATLIQNCWKTHPHERASLDDCITVISHSLRQKIHTTETEALYAKAVKYENAKNHTDAFTAYKEASIAQHTKARTGYAFYLLTGKGNTPINKLEAFKQMKISADEGDSRAQYNLAQMLEYGDGTQQDLSSALIYYKLAARQSYRDASVKAEKVTIKLAAKNDGKTLYNTPSATLGL